MRFEEQRLGEFTNGELALFGCSKSDENLMLLRRQANPFDDLLGEVCKSAQFRSHGGESAVV